MVVKPPKRYTDGTIQEIRRNPPHTTRYIQDGETLWEERMELARLWDEGGFFIRDGVYYGIVSVDVVERVQVVEVRKGRRVCQDPSA